MLPLTGAILSVLKRGVKASECNLCITESAAAVDGNRSQAMDMKIRIAFKRIIDSDARLKNLDLNG